MHLETVLVLFDFLADLSDLNATFGAFRRLNELTHSRSVDCDVADGRRPFLTGRGADPVEVDFVRGAQEDDPIELSDFLREVLVGPGRARATISEASVRPNQSLVLTLRWNRHLCLA